MTTFRPSAALPAARPAVEDRFAGKAGFSLIFMSLFITAMAILMVSFLPEAANDNAKTIDDIHKLETVEEHMRSFMAFNRRRPCPADGQYPINSPNFGREASNAGGCQGGTPSAPLGPDSSGNIVAGVIPTRSLGLDESYAFDSYGRRFTYVVDKRATTTAACDDLEGIENGNTNPTGKGGLAIDDAAGKQIDQVMYAYIQHGPEGYGAWPGDGSATALSASQSAAMRINSGSTDLAMQINAGVAPGANPGASSFAPDPINTLVRNSRILASTAGGKLDTGFDDLLWYRDDLKNTCCLGKKCIPLGFRIDGESDANAQEWFIAGVGDINGDGYPDLVLERFHNGSYGVSSIYVVFGTPSSANPAGWPIPPDGLDPTTLNGSNGFILSSPTCMGPLAVGDINGDGSDDLFITGCGKYFVLFGGAGPWPAAVNTSNFNGFTGVNGTSGVVIDTTMFGGALGFDAYNYEGGVQIGDVDGDGYKDLIAYDDVWYGTQNTGGFVIFGKPMTCSPSPCDSWANTPSIDISTLNGSNGFEMYSSNQTRVTIRAHTPPMKSPDVDNDHYADIIIADTKTSGAPLVSGEGAVFVIYGRPRSGGSGNFDWAHAISGSPPLLDINAQLSASPNGATELYIHMLNGDGYCCDTVTTADVNGDGIQDLLISSTYQDYPEVFYGVNGPANRWPAYLDITTPAASQGFSVDLSSAPSWVYGTQPYWPVAPFFQAADVNGDGRADLIVGVPWASPLNRAAAGAFLVFLQPAGGFGATVRYNSYHWDDTDSFAIYGPVARSYCGYTGPAYVADVRPGDGGKPEIIVPCATYGKTAYGSVYGLYKNKGWPSSIDLNNLN